MKSRGVARIWPETDRTDPATLEDVLHPVKPDERAEAIRDRVAEIMERIGNRH